MGEQVKVYSLPACPHCRNAKAYLDQKGIRYKDIDVGANKEAAKEMIAISGSRNVPVIVIGNEIVVGFDQPRIDAALQLEHSA